MREHTRTSTTVVNAYLGSVLSLYVNRIERFYLDNGVESPVRFYQSNGGTSFDIALATMCRPHASNATPPAR